MRTPIIAGNWKMHKTRDEALEFIYAVADKMPDKEKIETVICTPAPLLRSLVKRQGEHLRIGAQTMHESDEGAFTGEVSAKLLKELGVTYVIIGHSERRAYYNETDESVKLKVKQALKTGLKPIVCVGESLVIRESGKTQEFVTDQITRAMQDLDEAAMEKTIIAYEPIWAIGTGKSATSADANETIGQIRAHLKALKGTVANNVRILYGGSVKPATIQGLMQEPEIDGALVGGASLESSSFLELVHYSD